MPFSRSWSISITGSVPHLVRATSVVARSLHKAKEGDGRAKEEKAREEKANV